LPCGACCARGAHLTSQAAQPFAQDRDACRDRLELPFGPDDLAPHNQGAAIGTPRQTLRF
jgi:hypothetical protein